MENSPYAPPVHDPTSEPKLPIAAKNSWLAKIGILFYSGPVWGVLSMAAQMRDAFSVLANDNTAKPEELAQHISSALFSILIGAAIGLLGAVLIIIALLRTHTRKRSFLRWTLFLSVIWCLVVFPYGMMIGLPIGILFFSKRREFR